MLFVDTHTKRWGTIGSSTREDFVFAPGSNVRTAEGYSYVCGALPEPCVRTIDVFKRGSTEPGDAMLSATSTRRAGTMQGHLRASSTRGTSDSDVRRIDVVSVSAPPLRLHLRNHRATVTITTSDNGATGSGVAKATQEGYGGSVSCGDRHLRSTAWPRTRFTNGRTPLTFHTIVFGDIRVADSSHPYTTDVHYYRR
jgi:hypothetical protein